MNNTNDTLNKINGLSHDIKNTTQGVERSLESAAHEAGVRLGNMASDLASSANSYARTSREYVEENPVKGIAIAAGAGLVIGSLLTLILRRRS